MWRYLVHPTALLALLLLLQPPRAFADDEYDDYVEEPTTCDWYETDIDVDVCFDYTVSNDRKDAWKSAFLSGWTSFADENIECGWSYPTAVSLKSPDAFGSDCSGRRKCYTVSVTIAGFEVSYTPRLPACTGSFLCCFWGERFCYRRRTEELAAPAMRRGKEDEALLAVAENRGLKECDCLALTGAKERYADIFGYDKTKIEASLSTALKDFGDVTFFGEDEDPYPEDNDFEYIYDYTTCAPTSLPTKAPTEPPSNIPSDVPSDVPSEVPTTVPTTNLPTKPSETSPPTKAPTTSPTNAPTKEVECNDHKQKVCVSHASLSFGGR